VGDNHVQVKFECKAVDPPPKDARVTFHTCSTVQSACTDLLVVLVKQLAGKIIPKMTYNGDSEMLNSTIPIPYVMVRRVVTDERSDSGCN